MIKYNEEYDSYYDDELDYWTESKCNDETCEYCSRRPEKPSMVEDTNNNP